MLSPFLAVLAAIANGLASVLQRKAARDQPVSENLSLRLMWHLLHRPAWFGGILSVIAGFLLQAVALGKGRISVVERVLVLELPATLLLAALIFRSRLTIREWGAAAAMTAGLAALLYALSPSGGSSADVPWQRWAVAAGLNVGLVVVGVVWATSVPAGARRAAILGATTGCAFGLTAALIKGMTVAAQNGLAALFTSWQLYAMIVTGFGAMFLLQSAMNAGRLLATQPGLTLVDPVISILWGIFVFQEQARGGWYIVPAVAGAAVVTASVIALARSPLLSGESGRREGDEAESEPA
ncbi:MAG TPA: DMT family transporter [Streptomyces sp.]|nr:DMT family transporter [Streptomyces sp.]